MTRTHEIEREKLLHCQEALKDIKALVCGDKSPNFANEQRTIETRFMIADLVDNALLK